MDWKSEAKQLGRALYSIVKPVWTLHGVLGPLSLVVALGLSAWVGFVTHSPSLGVVALLGALLMLAVVEVWRRERGGGSTARTPPPPHPPAAPTYIITGGQHTWGVGLDAVSWGGAGASPAAQPLAPPPAGEQDDGNASS
jgi:hypothetical protein